MPARFASTRATAGKPVPVIKIFYPRDAVTQYLEYGGMYDVSLRPLRNKDAAK